MRELQTIILAAGKGTRMKSELPKVLHPVGGRPLIHYVFDLAQGTGAKKIYLVLGHGHKKIQQALNKNPRLRIVLQRRLLGTADAVKAAAGSLKQYNGDVLILSGDAILLKKETLKSLLQKHRKREAACTFLTTVIQDPRGYGRIIRGFGGKAVAIREEKDATEHEKNIMEVNAGVYCFQAPVLFKLIHDIKINPKKKEYYLTDIIALAAQQKQRIETLEAEDPAEGLGINTREDLARAQSVVRRRILRELMLNGVTITDPATTYVAQGAKIGRDTVINPFVVIESNVRVGAGCRIGPFARLRSGTWIADNVELGNFVEVSRTRIGARSLMKHFSFLGDARLGRKVNIGAGAVTANYDGKNKNVTHIGDEAFIGSDSILVAPVNVGAKAITGAGCVVTRGHSVPAGGVVVGVPARRVNAKKSTPRRVRKKKKT